MSFEVRKIAINHEEIILHMSLLKEYAVFKAFICY